MKVLLSIVIMVIVWGGSEAQATFSIVAHDEKTGFSGVAISSYATCTGAELIAAVPGRGAIAVQGGYQWKFMKNSLDLLKQGMQPQLVLKHVLNGSPSGSEFIQIGIAGEKNAATYTGGGHLYNISGGISEKTFAVQGNSLSNVDVLTEMKNAYLTKDGTLGDKLTETLRRGSARGGDIRGERSAALVISNPEGRIVELRVDDHMDPISELERLYLKNKELNYREDSEYRNSLILVADYESLQLGFIGLSTDPFAKRLLNLSGYLDEFYEKTYSRSRDKKDKENFFTLLINELSLKFLRRGIYKKNSKLIAIFTDQTDQLETKDPNKSAEENLKKLAIKHSKYSFVIPMFNAMLREKIRFEEAFRSIHLRVLYGDERSRINLVLQDINEPWNNIQALLRRTLFINSEPSDFLGKMRECSSWERPAVNECRIYETHYSKYETILRKLAQLYPDSPIQQHKISIHPDIVFKQADIIISTDKEGRPQRWIEVKNVVYDSKNNKFHRRTELRFLMN